MSPVRLELDPSVINYYQKVLYLIKEASSDDDWKEILQFVTGSTRLSPPCPVLNESVQYGAAQVAQAHIGVLSGFLSFFFSSTPKDYPAEVISTILESHKVLAIAGGWQVYWPGIQTLNAIKAGISRVNQVKPDVPWQEQTIETTVGGFDINLHRRPEAAVPTTLNLFTWTSEFVAVNQLFVRLGEQAIGFMSHLDEYKQLKARALLFHSDGYARLEKPGEVYPMLMLTEDELNFIVYFLPIVSRGLLNEVRRMDQIFDSLKSLNALAIQALIHGHENYLTEPYLAVHGVKVIETALQVEFMAADSTRHRNGSVPLHALAEVDAPGKYKAIKDLLSKLPNMPEPTRH